MNNKAFSSIDLVGQCLLDTQRTEAFKNVIEKTINKDSIVLDIGTGSGVLAMLAAKAGAKKVFAVELDKFVADSAYKNFQANELQNDVKLIYDDACSFDVKSTIGDDKINVVLMELITSGMIDEAQINAVSHLKERGCLSPEGTFIPKSQKSFVTLVDYNFELYGLDFPMVTHIWNIHRNDFTKYRIISEKTVYDDYVFSDQSRKHVDVELPINITQNGRANAVLIESDTHVDDHTIIGETSAINGKVIVPLVPKELLKDSITNIHIKYEYGKGFDNLNVQIK